MTRILPFSAHCRKARKSQLGGDVVIVGLGRVPNLNFQFDLERGWLAWSWAAATLKSVSPLR